MKTTTLILCICTCIFAGIFLGSCRGGKSDPNDKIKIDSLTKALNQFESPLYVNEPGEVDGTKSLPLPVEAAAKELYEMIRHDTLDHFVAIDAPKLWLGGAFCIEDFFPSTLHDATNQGVVMWYCFNSNNVASYPRFFLGIEHMHKDRVSDALRPSRPLRFTTQSTLYEGAVTEAALKHHIEGHRQRIEITCSSGSTAFPNTTIPAGFISRFRTWQCDHPRRNRPNEVFHLSDWAFFQNNDKLLKSLVTYEDSTGAKAKYVRYYFAFDRASRAQNSIRIFLVPVDSTGKNMSGFIVQKSIP